MKINTIFIFGIFTCTMFFSCVTLMNKKAPVVYGYTIQEIDSKNPPLKTRTITYFEGKECSKGIFSSRKGICNISPLSAGQVRLGCSDTREQIKYLFRSIDEQSQQEPVVIGSLLRECGAKTNSQGLLEWAEFSYRRDEQLGDNFLLQIRVNDYDRAFAEIITNKGFPVFLSEQDKQNKAAYLKIYDDFVVQRKEKNKKIAEQKANKEAEERAAAEKNIKENGFPLAAYFFNPCIQAQIKAAQNSTPMVFDWLPKLGTKFQAFDSEYTILSLLNERPSIDLLIAFDPEGGPASDDLTYRCYGVLRIKDKKTLSVNVSGTGYMHNLEVGDVMSGFRMKVVGDMTVDFRTENGIANKPQKVTVFELIGPIGFAESRQ